MIFMAPSGEYGIITPTLHTACKKKGNWMVLSDNLSSGSGVRGTWVCGLGHSYYYIS